MSKVCHLCLNKEPNTTVDWGVSIRLSGDDTVQEYHCSFGFQEE